MDNYIIYLVVGLVIVAAFVLIQRAGLASKETAQVAVSEGAMIIDVRSGQEFRSQHLPGAINIPLDGIREQITSTVQDKGKPVLLHCLSGARSARARSILRQLGYTRVYNLGSFTRARQILAATRQPN